MDMVNRKLRTESSLYTDLLIGTIRQQTSSVDPSRSARPRPAVRRATSTHYPHKGQEFSVDDAEEEIDEVMGEQRKLERPGRIAGGSIKGGATLRRRTTAQISTLSKVRSAQEEETGHPTADIGAQVLAEEPEIQEELADEPRPEEVDDGDD